MISDLIFLIAVLATTLVFVVRLLFTSTSGSQIVDEWKSESGFSLMQPFSSFMVCFGLPLPPLMIPTLIILFCSAIYLWLLEVFPLSLIIPPITTVVAGLVAFGILNDMVRWRSAQFEDRLSSAIDVILAGLNSGHNPRQALEMAAASTEDMVGKELEEIVNRLDMGMPIEGAVKRMVTGFDSEGVRLFTQSLQAKWNEGGELVTVLSSLNRVIRQHARIRMEMTSQLSGLRYTGTLLGLLPYGLFTFLLLEQPQWIDGLLKHPLGHKLIIAALLLQVFGLIWLRRILRSRT